MPTFIETEEFMLLQQIIAHYAAQLRESRDKIADLERRLAASTERMQLLECSIYGASFL